MKKLFIAIIISIVIVMATPVVIGIYLSPQDELQKADLIVVVSGGETAARVKEGVWLYESGYAPKILFSGAAAEGDVSNALSMKRIAMRDGVPNSNILIEEDSKDTLQNAEFSAKIIKNIGAKSIILSTSPYHQRRTYTHFRYYLGSDTKISNWSAKDSTWRKLGWWKNEESVRLTFSELLKIFYSETNKKEN